MARFRPLSSVLIASLLVPSVGGAAPAPQGATREDRASVSGLAAFTAGAQLDGLPRSVDLRPLLPPVGTQTMNDCAAWAFGYAGRTYLEALDQGWKPDAPERIFSPTFIYNQVNGGVDGGSRVDKVLELLAERGAATLGTAPYLAKDFTTQPPKEASEEAEVFRIASFGLLKSGGDIRGALAENHIVLCCVRTNPVFSSGRYPVYTKVEHERGQAARRADQPHGFHAMAIVGYSDDRNAFLFMNSWGEGWGDRGFVWVGYDAVETFNQNGVTEELLDFAVVMIDRREPVVKVDERYAVANFSELEAFCTGTFSGYDEGEKAGSYRYTVSLRGPEALLNGLERVEWTVPGPAGERTVASTDRGAGFRVSGRSPSAKIQISGTAQLKSGHTVNLDVEVAIPETARRALSLERTDAFHESTSKGDLWRWTLLPRMADSDWRDLVEIEWSLDAGSGLTAPARYVHGGGLPPAWTLASKAMPSFVTAAPVAGSAVLLFRDGTRHELTIPPTPFTDPVREDLSQEIVWRPVGVDGDRHWYFYELRVRYPEAWADNILGVSIETGSHVDWGSVEAEFVDGPGPRMHVMHGFAKRPFRTFGRASFRERHPQLGTSTPVMNSSIVPLGNEAAWQVPPLADPGVINAGTGFGIESTDRYVGQIDGAPVWEFDIVVDGTANAMVIDAVRWTVDGVETEFDKENASPLEGYVVHHRASSPFEVSVECTLWDGQSFTLERTIQPFAPESSSLAVDLTDVTPGELRRAAPERVLAQVALAGLPPDLEGLREVVGYSERAFGGVLRTQVVAIDFNLGPDGPLGRIEVPAAEPTLFVLDYDDGSAIALESTPHVLAPAPALPRFQLLARERFAGWRTGQPSWTVALEIRGEESVLRQLERVEWASLPIDGGDAGAVPREGDTLRSATLTVDRPTRVTAVLHFGAAAGAPPIEVTAPVLTQSRRTTGALRVEAERGWIWDPIERYGPGVDLFSISWPSTPYRFRIVGALPELEAVDAVRWIARDPWADRYALDKGEPLPEPEVHTSDAATLRHLGFEWHTDQHPDGRERRVTPELVFSDGTTRRLDAFDLVDGMPVATRREKVPAAEIRPWGSVDGRPVALLIAGIPEADWTTRLQRATFTADRALEPFGNLPAAAFERPTARRAFLIDAPGELQGLSLRKRLPDHGGFDEESERLTPPVRFTLPPMDATPTVALQASEEGGGTFWYLAVDVAEETLSRTCAVRWTFSQGERRSESVVRDRIGERSDAFELRLYGARPSAIEAILLDAQGSTLATATLD